MSACYYMAVDWTGNSWVRYETCQVVDDSQGKGIYIGIRLDIRRVIKTEQAPCTGEINPKSYVRYQIGDKEYICIIK